LKGLEHIKHFVSNLGTFCFPLCGEHLPASFKRTFSLKSSVLGPLLFAHDLEQNIPGFVCSVEHFGQTFIDIDISPCYNTNIG